jgi:hypothetical protein
MLFIIHQLRPSDLSDARVLSLPRRLCYPAFPRRETDETFVSHNYFQHSTPVKLLFFSID